jgi:hypothetical protein
MKEPIITFRDKQELIKSTEEWKHRLFLDSWIISVGFHEEDEYPDENGHVSFSMENKTATVTILSTNKDDRIFKKCDELILVHELLHLKIGYISAPEGLEGTHFDLHEHALIYELSKSLIMAKYGIGLNWFINAESCVGEPC